MLPQEDNDTLTQTNRGTPMGEVFRRFWIPVLLSRELPLPDCTPVRFRLLNEDLVGFRDSAGRVGVMDTFCPHRGANLFYGRNEEGGLRCLYHGWKFDVTGACLEMPNLMNGEVVRTHMQAIAYPTVERAGMIWAYMGPAERTPPFPEFEYFDLPQESVYVDKYEIGCNWLQGQEGDHDPTHVQFLHSHVGDKRRPLPRVPLDGDTPIGILKIVTQPRSDGTMGLRVRQIVMPCFTAVAGQEGGVLSSNIRIPVDDTHLWHFRLRYTRREGGFTDEELSAFKYDGYIFDGHEAGSWRPRANYSNDYNQDRVMQRQFSFSGVSAFQDQDVMMIENQWGAIADRTREHLVASDRPIVQQRNRLLQMAKSLAEGRELEEPFLLKGVRQDVSISKSVLPLADELDEETIAEILEALNTTIVTNDGSGSNAKPRSGATNDGFAGKSNGLWQAALKIVSGR